MREYKDDEVYLEFLPFNIDEDAEEVHTADPGACIACGHEESNYAKNILELKIINAVYPYPDNFVKIRLCAGCRDELKTSIESVSV